MPRSAGRYTILRVRLAGIHQKQAATSNSPRSALTTCSECGDENDVERVVLYRLRKSSAQAATEGVNSLC